MGRPILRTIVREHGNLARYRRSLTSTICLSLALACPIRLVVAQDQAAQKQEARNQTSELTEGLLDLLKEPPARDSEQPILTPADVGLENEDLSEQSNDPLLAVRQSMLIAAGFLEKGMINSETQQLQSDIVKRLDELIDEFEQAQNDQRTAQQQQQQQQQQEQPNPEQPQSQPQQQSSALSSTTPMEQQSSSQAAEPSPDGDARPGQAGAATDAVENLNDPVALQQSVWGQLPERVRQQMQSQMVEQFLPSYKAQIEAYFKALLEQE